MKYSFTILLLCSSLLAFAQQDALFSKYMFNSLTFNPAYAGSKDYLTMSLINRAQWLGWNNGATQNSGLSSQSVAAHSPLNPRVGVGIHFVGDAIGATRTNKLNLAYAYRIPFEVGTLAIGMQAGLSTWQADWSTLTFQDTAKDPAFFDTQVNSVLPSFGTGLYFQTQDYYLGFSVPSLLNLPLPSESSTDPTLEATARNYRTFFFMAGTMLSIIPKQLSVKPSLLYRKTGFFVKAAQDLSRPNRAAAPSTLDLDCSVLLLDFLWLGVGYRASLGANTKLAVLNTSLAFYLNNGMRIGMAYDYDVGAIRRYTNGSLELMIGYDFNYQVGRVQSPRYF